MVQPGAHKSHTLCQGPKSVLISASLSLWCLWPPASNFQWTSVSGLRAQWSPLPLPLQALAGLFSSLNEQFWSGVHGAFGVQEWAEQQRSPSGCVQPVCWEGGGGGSGILNPRPRGHTAVQRAVTSSCAGLEEAGSYVPHGCMQLPLGAAARSEWGLSQGCSRRTNRLVTASSLGF